MKLLINNKLYFLNLKKNLNKRTVLQICNYFKISIPQFCYHEELPIAGNCRICLVELKNNPKLVVACSTIIQDGMEIITDSLRIKKVRESIMEFLLLEHPLDCAICDQGGDCDLQEQSFLYGNDVNRNYDYIKRVKESQNLGIVVKTVMNRCIQCTRCVRFIFNFLNRNYLGVMGRGKNMEISDYLNNINSLINIEFSSNLIDLCPVGALTSKFYSFSSRKWELNRIYNIDVLDSFGNSIYIYTKSSYNFSIYNNLWDKVLIMKIYPKLNKNLNNYLINDKSRFFFDSLYRNRLYSWGLSIKYSQYNVLNYSSFYIILSYIYLIIFLLYPLYFFKNNQEIEYLIKLKIKYLYFINNYFYI